jgi:hypothetical protein
VSESGNNPGGSALSANRASPGALAPPASRNITSGGGGGGGGGRGDSLVDLLDRVLDKGVVIAGDIKINLLDIELLTIKIRLLIASADKAREMGIDWWAHDPQLSSKAQKEQQKLDVERENKELRQRVEELESRMNRLLASAERGGGGERSRTALPAGARRARTE